MRIAHGLLSHEFAGAERHLAELAAWQTGQGHQVHLLLETLTPDIEKRWRHAAPQARLHFLPAWWPAALSGLWALIVLKKISPDVYHAHLGRAARRLGWAARVLRIPFVATLHLQYRKKEHAKASGLIRICNWQVRDMGAYKGHAQTIWNWVGDAKKPPADARKKIRAGLEADKNTLVFVSVGRMVKQKGMDVLVRAFQKAFPKGNENVRLLLVGTGPDESAVNAVAALDGRIVPVGYVNDVTPLYAAADVFISAARYEPFGLVVTEAMSHGLPLVLTRTDGPAEFLGRVKNVLWAEPDNEASLATALKRAKAEKTDYDLSAFSIGKAGPAVMVFYKKVIGH